MLQLLTLDAVRVLFVQKRLLHLYHSMHCQISKFYKIRNSVWVLSVSLQNVFPRFRQMQDFVFSIISSTFHGTFSVFYLSNTNSLHFFSASSSYKKHYFFYARFLHYIFIIQTKKQILDYVSLELQSTYIISLLHILLYPLSNMKRCLDKTYVCDTV